MSITKPTACSSCWGTGINITGAACKSCWPLSLNPTLPNSAELEKLRRDLADMTAQRDRAINGWDSTRLDADRLDAQRYRDTRTIYCVSNGVPESDSDDQTDLYISVHKNLLAKATGGQP
jgi:hypothetical protein